MKKKKLAWLVALATPLLLIVVAVSFFMSYTRYRPTGSLITLPGNGDTSITLPSSDVGENGAVLDGVIIDKTNVKRVIGTLVRPQEYYIEAETGIYFHSTKKENKSAVYHKNALSKIDIFSKSGTLQKSIIITPTSYYSWNSGARGFYKGAIGEYNYDDAAGMPTYEDVLALDDALISDAGYEKKDGQACIYVSVLNSASGGLDKYYISALSGLLYAAESYIGDMQTYSMRQTSFAVKEISSDNFVLPNGQAITE